MNKELIADIKSELVSWGSRGFRVEDVGRLQDDTLAEHLANAGFSRRPVLSADNREALIEVIVDNNPSRDGVPKVQDVWLAQAILEKWALPVTPEPTEETVERVAAAIAEAANAHYWVGEIAEWESGEDWEREAHPESRPGTAYEDRDEFRKQARAALAAALVLPSTPEMTE